MASSIHTNHNKPRTEKRYFKILQAIHHAEVMSLVISTGQFPPGMFKQVQKLTAFIKPSSPCEQTRDKIRLNTDRWMRHNMLTLREHYDGVIAENIRDLPVFDLMALDKAIAYGKSRYRHKLTPSSVTVLTDLLKKESSVTQDLENTVAVCLDPPVRDGEWPELGVPGGSLVVLTGPNAVPLPPRTARHRKQVPGEIVDPFSSDSLTLRVTACTSSNSVLPARAPLRPPVLTPDLNRPPVLAPNLNRPPVLAPNLNRPPVLTSNLNLSPVLTSNLNLSPVLASNPNLSPCPLSNPNLFPNSIPRPPVSVSTRCSSPISILDAIRTDLSMPVTTPVNARASSQKLVTVLSQKRSGSMRLQNNENSVVRRLFTVRADVHRIGVDCAGGGLDCQSDSMVEEPSSEFVDNVPLDDATEADGDWVFSGGVECELGEGFVRDSECAGLNRIQQQQLHTVTPTLSNVVINSQNLGIGEDSTISERAVAEAGMDSRDFEPVSGVLRDISSSMLNASASTPEAGTRKRPTRHETTAQKIRVWNLQIRERVVVVGDSNLARIPHFDTPGVQVDSFPGAQIHHLKGILLKLSPCERVDKVILSVGLNNCLKGNLIDTIRKQFQNLVSLARRVFPNAHIIVPLIQCSSQLSSPVRQTIKQTNVFLKNTYTTLDFVDDHLFKVTSKDLIHWTADTALHIFDNWMQYLN